MSTEELAYIAGYFDGEGCISVRSSGSGKNSYMSQISVVNRTKEVLDLLQNIWGGKVYEREDNRKKNHGTTYQWLISSHKNKTAFLKDIIPFLKQKKRQAVLLARYLEERDKSAKISKNGKRYWSQMTPVTEEQEKLLIEIKELNAQNSFKARRY